MKRALISVSDKTNIEGFAKKLIDLDFEIISTGGTKKILDAVNIPTIGIEDITGFPEMLDGRVKTLHPKIHGGLLGRRDLPEHLKQMQEHDIKPIDLVVVNLYPFKETLLTPDTSHEEMIEQIDIGGPSMLRSAAKNYAAVTVVVDPDDYEMVLGELENGDTMPATREKLAAKVFRHTAAYDALIAQYLTEKVGETKPEKLTMTYEYKQGLRYGENSYQGADFYQNALPVIYSLANSKQLHGKELSYNNLRDADMAIRMIRDFSDPTVVAVKHMNPCGVGTGKDIFTAYEKAYDADSTSIFGGIIVLNRVVDVATAEKMHAIFLEIIIAPDFEAEALEILTQKKNIRLLTLNFSEAQLADQADMVSVLGGVLQQAQDFDLDASDEWTVATKRKPTAEELQALKFAWKVVKYVKSNAIVLANAQQTVGIGAGQMNRIGSVEIALKQAMTANKLAGAVLASDAFFPMDDSVALAAEYGIKAIIQPGGSIKDQASIDMADKHDIAMIFTHKRHFRH